MNQRQTGRFSCASALLTQCAAALLCSAAHAQCEGWQDFSGEWGSALAAVQVHDLIQYEDDLIACGNIFAVEGVARWDGVEWSQMGSFGAQATAMAVYKGELIVAGDHFKSPGDGRIARWDGSMWETIGEHTDGTVIALAVYDGELVAGGFFTKVGSTAVNHIMRWDETLQSWQPLGSGANDWVFVLTVYEGDLIAGGQFSQIGGEAASCVARWDGSSWHALGHGLEITSGGPPWVRGLAVYEGDLVAGGSFNHSGSNTAKGVARWDGSQWQALGSGVGGAGWVMRAHHGGLIVGGDFNSAGGSSANLIARWDGSGWHALGSGLSYSFGPGGVSALAGHKGRLLAGGLFSSAGGEPTAGLARWDESGACCINTRCAEVCGSQCLALGGFFHGYGTTCETVECMPATGACCVDGIAVDVSEDLCGTLEGVFHGVGVPADSIRCDPPCAPDLDGNNAVDVSDLLDLLGAWGSCP